MAKTERLLKNPYPAEYIEMIIDSVCKTIKVDRSDLVGKCRKRELADGRKIVVYLSEKYIRAPLSLVAESIGMNSSTAVTHQKKACANLMRFDADFRNIVELIETDFQLN